MGKEFEQYEINRDVLPHAPSPTITHCEQKNERALARRQRKTPQFAQRRRGGSLARSAKRQRHTLTLCMAILDFFVCLFFERVSHSLRCFGLRNSSFDSRFLCANSFTENAERFFFSRFERASVKHAFLRHYARRELNTHSLNRDCEFGCAFNGRLRLGSLPWRACLLLAN